MSLHFYTEKEDYLKEESINKYVEEFLSYVEELPSLSDALKQMFISCQLTEEQANDLIKDILTKTEEIINKNWDKIKKRYSKISKEDSNIICSYTCESKNNKYSPYKILNKNLVSEDRKGGIKNISKYLFILLKSLRKLDRYYPNEKEKYLYRCINFKVNLNYDLFNKKLVPYITGNTKTFWGFTSSSPDIAMTYNFLKEEGINKSGTIFTLAGKIWGYDISLFNYYNEKEILIEPERKFKIDEVMPPINDIIHIRCDIQDSPIILDEELINKTIQKNNMVENKNKFLTLDELEYDYLLKYVLVGDYGTGKTNIRRFLSPNTKPTIGVDFTSKTIKIRNKIYRIQIWDTAGYERYKSIARAYFRGASCSIIVYNTAKRDTFSHIPDYIEECKLLCPKTVTIVLVGNNIHEEENEREVTFDEGKLLAEKYGIQFFEVDSLTGQNINELFYSATDNISKKINEGFYDLNDSSCGIIKSNNNKFETKLNNDSKCLII